MESTSINLYMQCNKTIFCIVGKHIIHVKVLWHFETANDNIFTLSTHPTITVSNVLKLFTQPYKNLCTAQHLMYKIILHTTNNISKLWGTAK